MVRGALVGIFLIQFVKIGHILWPLWPYHVC